MSQGHDTWEGGSLSDSGNQPPSVLPNQVVSLQRDAKEDHLARPSQEPSSWHFLSCCFLLFIQWRVGCFQINPLNVKSWECIISKMPHRKQPFSWLHYKAYCHSLKGKSELKCVSMAHMLNSGIFFKLLSISREIKFCLYVLCKIAYALRRCRELQRKMFFLGQRWRRAAVVGKTKMCCPKCREMGTQGHQQTERRNGFCCRKQTIFQANKLWSWTFCHMHVF